MCGIIGVVSQRAISSLLLEGLRRLEYRGYDSAGMAILNPQGEIVCLRTEGKVQALADAMKTTSLVGMTGIAHTRWATHGKPSEENAHPHLSGDELAIVHNGIIENYEELRRELSDLGYKFRSETDSETAAHLIHHFYSNESDLLQAVQKAGKRMKGAFALAVIHHDKPQELIALRKGSPLVVGFGIDETFIASDTIALRSFSQAVTYLEEGDSAQLSHGTAHFYDHEGKRVERPQHPLNFSEHVNIKGKYRHFMLKEIDEQPLVLAETLEGRVAGLEVLRTSFGEKANSLFGEIRAIHIVACGTSYHAGLVARYWLESLTKLPTQVEIASEYRYRDVVVPPSTLFITVSQSGETADVLAALQKAKSLPYLMNLAVCNVATSSLVREADAAFLTRAGVEIGVASTKAFTTQLTAFLMLATALCQDDRALEVIEQLNRLPAACENVLMMKEKIKKLSNLFVNKSHALFVARGVHYPIALEGALKLKEISYIHAEAYPAGELKHGPLALVDEEMPVIAIAPNDELLDKLKSNLQEVSARGGQLIVFASDEKSWQANGAEILLVSSKEAWIAPILYTIPLQLLAYYVAVAKGTDVDQPRNLAKSVTVE